MTNNKQPIGIFDSGVGGLTVAHAIATLLPHENTIYFGDTAHLPYGDKSTEAVRQYSKRITEFLMDKNCKMVVIACNTASAAAFEELKKIFGEKIMLVDVIEPMVNHIKNNFAHKKIGIIATKGTVGSGIYENKLKAADVNHVSSLATPLLVHLIEEGFSKHQGSNLLVQEYLHDKKLRKIDVLVLACTHYPILKNTIEDFYHHEVTVLDSTIITAEVVQAVLQKNNLLNTQKTKAIHQFFVSDFTPAFEQITKVFYGSEIHLEKCDIWN
ncbi:MAG: glutamate racemase [Bacteroidota bacterium]|jgi:glutamate racemase